MCLHSQWNLFFSKLCYRSIIKGSSRTDIQVSQAYAFKLMRHEILSGAITLVRWVIAQIGNLTSIQAGKSLHLFPQTIEQPQFLPVKADAPVVNRRESHSCQYWQSSQSTCQREIIFQPGEKSESFDNQSSSVDPMSYETADKEWLHHHHHHWSIIITVTKANTPAILTWPMGMLHKHVCILRNPVSTKSWKRRHL
jgi:hypothetical protein